MTAKNRIRAAALTATCVIGLTGCALTSNLPLTKGSGSNATVLTFTLANASNLVPASQVMLNDVTVGSVRSVTFRNWKAVVTIGVDASVRLPANVSISVGQKSLLGAQYVDLVVPADDTAPPIASGTTIAPARTSAAPTTEQILTAAGALFGNGGLAELGPITRELNNAFTGHQQDWRSLLVELNTLLSNVRGQHTALVGLLNSTNTLGSRLAAHDATLSAALATIPRGLAILNGEQQPIVDALRSLDHLGNDLTPVLTSTQHVARADLINLAKTVYGLAASARTIPGAVGIITFPVPLDSVPKALRGDYLNLVDDINLTLPVLDRNFLSGTPLAGLLTSMNGVLPSITALEAGNPLISPLTAISATGNKTASMGTTSSGKAPSGTPTNAAGLAGLLTTLLGGGSQ